jgi:hypothetical protein
LRITGEAQQFEGLGEYMRKITIVGSFIALGAIIAGISARYFQLAIASNGTAQLSCVLAFVLGLTFIIFDLHAGNIIGSPALDRVTFALAVGAIIFAVWQFRDSRVQEARMEDLSKEMSTRFAGMFPKNMRDINEILQQVDNNLDIMADFVGYGHYSAPDEFDKYFRRLQDLRSQKNMRIRIIVYTLAKGRKVHDTQFTQASFEKAQKSRDPRLLRFCDKYNGGRIPNTKQEFDDLLFRKQRDYIKDLKDRGIDIRVTDADLPFFLWTEDDQESVFSFLNEDLPQAREATFRTRDSSLIIDTFKVRFCKIWNAAHEVELTQDGWIAASAAPKSRDICVVH